MSWRVRFWCWWAAAAVFYVAVPWTLGIVVLGPIVVVILGDDLARERCRARKTDPR